MVWFQKKMHYFFHSMGGGSNQRVKNFTLFKMKAFLTVLINCRETWQGPRVTFLFWAGQWKISGKTDYQDVKGELCPFKMTSFSQPIFDPHLTSEFLFLDIAASYQTNQLGFLKAIVDAPCPTQVGDNNWVDRSVRTFNQPIIIRPCPEHEGAHSCLCIKYAHSCMSSSGSGSRVSYWLTPS